MTIEQEREELMKRTPTLRDWFASAALSGFTANTAMTEGLGHAADGRGDLANQSLWIRSILVATAYQYADAMLAEREKKGAQ